MEVGLSLGSNIEDRVAYLSQARARVDQHDEVELLCYSSLYETEPVDVQPAFQDLKFMNAVLIVESALRAEAWLSLLETIEYDLGRVRTEDKNAPRTIDIDVLYLGDEMMDSGGLIVPHPRWAERCFVLTPLSELRPDLVLPGQDKSVSECLKQLQTTEELSKIDSAW